MTQGITSSQTLRVIAPPEEQSCLGNISEKLTSLISCIWSCICDFFSCLRSQPDSPPPQSITVAPTVVIHPVPTPATSTTVTSTPPPPAQTTMAQTTPTQTAPAPPVTTTPSPVTEPTPREVAEAARARRQEVIQEQLQSLVPSNLREYRRWLDILLDGILKLETYLGVPVTLDICYDERANRTAHLMIKAAKKTAHDLLRVCHNYGSMVRFATLATTPDRALRVWETYLARDHQAPNFDRNALLIELSDKNLKDLEGIASRPMPRTATDRHIREIGVRLDRYLPPPADLSPIIARLRELIDAIYMVESTTGAQADFYIFNHRTTHKTTGRPLRFIYLQITIPGKSGQELFERFKKLDGFVFGANTARTAMDELDHWIEDPGRLFRFRPDGFIVDIGALQLFR